jgi:hypothetical protein
MSCREDYEPRYFCAAGADISISRRKASGKRNPLRLLPAALGEDEKPEVVIAKISQESLAENGRHDALARQLFHEQMPQAGVRRLQSRRLPRPLLTAQVLLHD